jgi:membrane-anchored protein YejM (alkaline phosphatase superfamily)
MPGEKPRVISGITSHLDIPATVMPLLGVRNPPGGLFTGVRPAQAADFHRDYAVAADWHRIAYIGDKVQGRLPHQCHAGVIAASKFSTATTGQ